MVEISTGTYVAVGRSLQMGGGGSYITIELNVNEGCFCFSHHI